MVHQQINVSLGDRAYPIYIGSGMTASFAPTCRHHAVAGDVVVVTDTTVGRKYLRPLEKNLLHHKFRVASIVIPPGERQKSLQRVNAIVSAMLKDGVGRSSTVVALGGGVVGDLAGFVAAVYQRGVQFIQVPTTLLAQVDSSVGGKVGVNHPLGKNMIGAFYQPAFVWTDVDCLKTLPEREITCGLGEIIKYGVIWDEELFSFLESNLDRVLSLDREAVMHVLARCCKIKAHIVEQDEREAQLRMVLNFGHTVGHALEAAGNFRALKHGEAVLLGMAAESFLAREMGLLDADAHRRIEALVERVPLHARGLSFAPSEVVRAMGRDKKAVDGKKRFVLPTSIGKVRVVEDVGLSLIQASVKRLLKRGR